MLADPFPLFDMTGKIHPCFHRWSGGAQRCSSAVISNFHRCYPGTAIRWSSAWNRTGHPAPESWI